MNPQPPPKHPIPGVPQNESELNVEFPDHVHVQPRGYTARSVHYPEAQPHPYPHPPHMYPPYIPPDAPYVYPPHHGPGYRPQVGGGGEYRLRPTIKLSPNAPKVFQNAARRREEAIQKSEEATQKAKPVDHLEGLDPAAFDELTADWNPSPYLPQDTPLPPLAGTPPPVAATPLAPSVDELFTPTPRHPAKKSSTLLVPSADDEPEPFTPAPRRPASSAEHLFTPTLASRHSLSPLQDTNVQEAVFDALGFQPVEIPSPPPAASIPTGNIQEGDDSGSDVGARASSGDGAGAESAKKGRPDKASEEVTAQLEENVNKLFEAASKATGRTVDSLVSQWHGTSKYGVKQSPWNDYQHYFKMNVEKERRRAGQPDGNANDCWQSFKLKPNYQQIMAISLELEKAQEDTTVMQRGKAFRKLTDAQESLVNKAARERVETFVFMAGSSINEDSNLTFLFASEGMEDFVTKRLQMAPSDFIALAKTQIYSHASDEFIKDYIVARGVTKPQPPHGAKQKPPRAAPAQVVEDDKEGESEGEGDDDENSSGLVHSADDDRTEVKKMFSALFLEHNLKTRTFPWSGLLAQLLKWRVQLVSWPADVPFPSETLKVDDEGNRKSSQGIKLLKSKPVRSLLAALTDPAKPIRIVTGLPKRDLEQEKLPLIVCAAPPHGSEHRAGRRQFAGGRIDSRGPPALGISVDSTRTNKKSKSISKPPPDTEIPDPSTPNSPPSTRTRSRSNPRAKRKARVESDNDDDDDDTPLVSVHTKSTRRSASTVNVESDDSDPEGANAVDPHDTEFDMPEDDQSEVETKPKSPKKTGRGKRKAEAVTSVKGKEKDDSKVEKAAHATTPAPTPAGVKALAPTKKVEKAAHVASVPTPLPAGATKLASITVDPTKKARKTTPALTPAPVDPTTVSTTPHPKPTIEDKVARAIASLESGRGLEHGDEPLAKRPRLEAVDTTSSDGIRAPPSSANPPSPRAPSRAPSHAPSAPSRAPSRAPSAPPHITATRPLSARPPPHFYTLSDITYDHPLAQRPPPSGMYHRNHGGAHPSYMRGGPAGRGRGGMPQSNDGAPYYAQRPPYSGEGYYTEYGYVHNYPRDPADSTHHPHYAPPYGYPRQETYPPYAAYGFGEAGPSRYADRYDAQSHAMAYADENEGVNPVAKEEMDIKGWTEVNNQSNPAE